MRRETLQTAYLRRMALRHARAHGLSVGTVYLYWRTNAAHLVARFWEAA